MDKASIVNNVNELSYNKVDNAKTSAGMDGVGTIDNDGSKKIKSKIDVIVKKK